MKGFREVWLSLGDVQGIHEGRNGVIIFGKSYHDRITIPAKLEGQDEFLGTLRSWTGPRSASALRARMLLVGIGTGAAIFAHAAKAWIQNPYLIVVAHAVAFASFVIYFYNARRNPDIDEQTRKLAYFVLLPAVVEFVQVIKYLWGWLS